MFFAVHHINGPVDYTAMCVHTESVVAIHIFLGFILFYYSSGRAQSNGKASCWNNAKVTYGL